MSELSAYGCFTGAVEALYGDEERFVLHDVYFDIKVGNRNGETCLVVVFISNDCYSDLA